MSDWQTEEWRPVVGWEDSYEVSNLGRARSIGRQREHNIGTRYHPGLMLTPRLTSNGYLAVTLRRGSTARISPLLHRLVAHAFIANPLNKPQINHIDCNPLNNAATNLEWCTPQENVAYAARLGRLRLDGGKGKRGPRAQLTNDQVRAMRASFATGRVSITDIAKQHGVAREMARRAITRKSYAYVE